MINEKELTLAEKEKKMEKKNEKNSTNTDINSADRV